MKLRRIELSGFKSFVDRTVITLDRQVTAIVGPNGCGKSNIIDAIRWAMGEQSARALRGKAMDEIIFAGSESRPGSSVTEVSLTFDNSSVRCHPDWAGFSEIAITRRLSREGTSDYFINGTACRLRDVTDLLLSAGVSPRSSMVEQGRMGMVVTARPEERRLLIEEAAGIAKYRLHRKVTQRKIEQTRQNLLRYSDVVAEMDKSLRTLKRQVTKARRFRELREELTDLELRVASHKYLELSTLSRRQASMLAEAERALRVVESRLQEREAEIVERRAEQREHETALDECQSRSYRCTNLVQQAEGKIERLAQQLVVERRAEAEGGLRTSGLSRRLDETDAELVKLRSEREQTHKVVEELQRQLGSQQGVLDEQRRGRLEVEATIERLRQQLTRASSAKAAGVRALESIEVRHREGSDRVEPLKIAEGEARLKINERETKIEACSAELAGLRQRTADLGAEQREQDGQRRQLSVELHDAETELERAGRDLTRCRSRLQSLEEIAGRYEHYGQGVRALMKKSIVKERTRAVVAELIDVPSQLETALAAVLGERLQDLVVDDLRAAAAVASTITAESVGRAAAIPVTPRAVGLSQPAPQAADVLGLLADLVSCESCYEPFVRQILVGIVVVRDLEVAQALWSDIGGEVTYVTLEGEVLSPNGRISAGREEVGLALLQTKREIRKLRVLEDQLALEHDRSGQRVSGLRAAITELNGVFERLRSDVHRGELEVVQQQQDIVRLKDDLRRQRSEAERLAGELLRLVGALGSCAEERERVATEIEEAEGARQAAEVGLAGELVELERRRQAEEMVFGEVTEVRVRTASARERLDAQSSGITRLAGECEDLRRRLIRAQRDTLQSAEAQGRLGGELFALRDQLGSLAAEASQAREELERKRTALEALRGALARMEADVHGERISRETQRELAEGLRLEDQELRLQRRALVERVSETRNLALEQVVVDYHLLPPVTAAEEDTIEELRRSLERLGPVNLTAVEEYEEISVRFEGASAQKRDLEESLGHLERAIKRLNRESRKRFRECFDEVNDHFQRIFPRLFEGGRARLVLTNEEDLLESGVDIVAQPPGKKLGRMELMSGGEKALTAVSLIFALFEASPSPFTVLDEVDAPFDDANNRRFLDVIREMASTSQFVMVTHSKLTMSASDVLYGVTMEEPGVSKMVAVRLRESPEKDEQAAAA